MPDAVRVRPMADADAPVVADLCAQLGYPSTPAEILARRARGVGGEDSPVLVALNEAGAVVGWIHVVERRSLESDPCAEIVGLVVDRDARRAGVGRALVAAAERWTADRGLPDLVVRTNALRPDAPSFYAALGFHLAKTSLKFHKSPGSSPPR